jgi:hypothetical protein
MAELAVHSVFRGYRIEAVAGRGGMGVVYRARDLALDRIVALKMIAPWLVEDEGARRRFLRESRLAAAIEHPHVLPIYAAGEHDGVAYLVMRFVSGEDLRTIVRASGPLDPVRAARTVARVAGALDAIHRAGLVHRDVKPANILFADSGHVYLSDFGLTRSTSTTSGPTRSGQWVGTAHYVAPEQIRGEAVDGRADVYALGGVLYFALTGEPPFTRDREEATLWAHLTEPPPRASALRPELPSAFDDVITRAMAKDPDDRYSSAGAFGRAVLAAVGLAAESEDATVAVRTSTGRRTRRPVRWIVVAAVAALGIAAALGAVVLGRDDDEEDATSTAVRGAATPREPRTIPVGGRPVAIAARRHDVWALVGRTAPGLVEAGTTRLVAISPSGNVRRGPALQADGEDLVAAGDSLYAVFDGPSRVLRLDGRTLRPVATSERFTGLTRRLSVGAGAVWVTERSRNPEEEPDHVLKLDSETLAMIARTPMPNGARDVRVGGGAVWVANRDTATVARLDPETAQPVGGATAGQEPQELAYGARSVWSANGDGTVTRVDARTRAPIVLAVGARLSAIEYRNREVWVASLASNTVTRVDAARMRADEPVSTCLNPASVAITPDDVWVACVGDRTIARIPHSP